MADPTRRKAQTKETKMRAVADIVAELEKAKAEHVQSRKELEQARGTENRCSVRVSNLQSELTRAVAKDLDRSLLALEPSR